MKYPGVYQIVNTQTGEIYIGSSRVCIFKRWGRHLRDLRKGENHNPRLQSAWNFYGEAAFEFSARAIVKHIDDVLVLEQHHLDMCDPRLLYNICEVAGSPLGMKHTPEARAKISAALKGRKLSVEHRANLGRLHKGKTVSPETREKLRLANLGKKPSKETRDKLSASRRGKKLSATHCAAVSAGLMGRKLSPELRATLVDIQKKLGATEEHRAKIRAGIKASSLRRHKATEMDLLI